MIHIRNDSHIFHISNISNDFCMLAKQMCGYSSFKMRDYILCKVITHILHKLLCKTVNQLENGRFLQNTFKYRVSKKTRGREREREREKVRQQENKNSTMKSDQENKKKKENKNTTKKATKKKKKKILDHFIGRVLVSFSFLVFLFSCFLL